MRTGLAPAVTAVPFCASARKRGSTRLLSNNGGAWTLYLVVARAWHARLDRKALALLGADAVARCIVLHRERLLAVSALHAQRHRIDRGP